MHKKGVSALAVSHNQRFFITGGVEGAVRIWDIKSRELVSHMTEHRDAVTCISIFDDDAHALTGSKVCVCRPIRLPSSCRHRMNPRTTSKPLSAPSPSLHPATPQNPNPDTEREA